MDDPKLRLVRNWLTKADHDLGSARKLASGDDPYLDTAIYHCQQAAEKALKAFLVFVDRPFEKTHSLTVLVDFAEPVAADFASMRDAAERLTPYATEFRYPSDVLLPDAGEFAEALSLADDVCRFVLARLPQELHPAGPVVACEECDGQGGDSSGRATCQEQPGERSA